MAKDFFDQDLVESKALRTAPPAVVPDGAVADELPARAISDLNLTRMARYREQKMAQQSEAVKELETIRRRAEELERERRTVEEESRQIDRFEQGRKEVAERLDQSLARLEKQEMQAIRMAELYAGTKRRFQELRDEIACLKEGEWEEARIREEVNRALVVIDDARKEYGKAMARIEAAESGLAAAADLAAPGAAAGVAGEPEPRDFRYWFKTGFAFFLPVMLFLLLLALAGLLWTSVAP